MRNSFSIIRRISGLFLLMFLATAVLSAFYFLTSGRNKLEDAERRLWENAEISFSEMSETLNNLKRHLVWLSSNAREISIWDGNTPYEQLLSSKKLISELDNFMMATKGVEAIIVAERNSDIIFERHTISDDAMLKILNIYNGRQGIVPVTPGLFAEKDGEKYSHLIFSHPIYVEKISNRYLPVIANIYVVIRAESVLPAHPAQTETILCFRRGDYLIPVTRTESADMLYSFQMLNENSSFMINGEKYFHRLYSLTYDNLYLVCLWQQSILMEQMLSIFIQGSLLIVVNLLLVIAGNRILQRNLQMPIEIMLKDVDRIRNGDFSYRLKQENAIEISRISESINRLLDELDIQNKKVIMQQKRLFDLELLNRESRILSLQSQINPHFLYNTLECVVSIARYYQVPQIRNIITGIIRIYRYSASSNRYGTVKSEFECAKNYTNVMNIRYENLFCFNFSLPPDLSDIEVPRMIVQPLIENAIQHGMLDRGCHGEIQTAAYTDDGDLVISVRDNGSGINEKKLDELRKHLRERTALEQKSNSIGLINVHTRINNEYGSNYGLSINSEEGVFTCVLIRIPLKKRNSDNAA